MGTLRDRYAQSVAACCSFHALFASVATSLPLVKDVVNLQWNLDN